MSQRLLLNRQALGVFEGQVGEGALLRRQCLVLACRHHRLRRGERARVAGEGARRAAPGVAGELVEQDDLCERA